MVTTNNVGPFNRFKRSTMNESYVEKYIRARKRHTASPKCLFGVPNENELDQYLLDRNTEEMVSNHEKLDKYEVEENLNLLNESEKDAGPSKNVSADESTASFSSNDAGEFSKFQPTVITEDNPAPAKNLFSPIDKPKLGTSTKDTQLEDTGYWQTTKRRRSLEEKKTAKKDPEDKVEQN